MFDDRPQPKYKDGSLVKVKGEFQLDGKSVYIDDYDRFGESIPIMGIVLVCVCVGTEPTSYDVMFDGEVVRTSEDEIELIQEGEGRYEDNEGK